MPFWHAVGAYVVGVAVGASVVGACDGAKVTGLTDGCCVTGLLVVGESVVGLSDVGDHEG